MSSKQYSREAAAVEQKALGRGGSIGRWTIGRRILGHGIAYVEDKRHDIIPYDFSLGVNPIRARRQRTSHACEFAWNIDACVCSMVQQESVLPA